MEVICRENCSGKTKQLIGKSLDTGYPILVLSESKRRSLEDKAEFYFGKRAITIGIQDLKTYEGKVLIDDLDENLDTLLGLAFSNPNLKVDSFSVSI